MASCRLVVGPGKEYAGGIAEVLNEFWRCTPAAWLTEPFDAGTVGWWFEDPDWDPMDTAVCLSDAGAVVGVGWAWAPEGEPGAARVSVYARPGLGWAVAREALLALLGWARWRALVRSRSVARVFLGPRWGWGYRVLQRILPGGLVVETGYLMVLTAPAEARRKLPSGYRLRELEPWSSIEEAGAVAEVFNDAFSVYPGFSEWRRERAHSYYQRLRERRGRGAIVLGAVDPRGGVVGFIEAYTHETLAGGVAGYLSLLAVKRKHQRRGIGTALLLEATRRLREVGAKTVYLDAVPEAKGLYEKLGFTTVAANTALLLPATALPGPEPAPRQPR